MKKYLTIENKLCLTILFFSILIYLPIFYQDIDFLDKTFLPDDTYYTLTISRNIAHGCGASIDCVDKTSGFQPLISIFQIPIFFITNQLYTPIQYSIFISMFFGILTNVTLAKLFYRIQPNFYLAGLFAIFNVILTNNILNYFNGLETSLACFLGVLVLLNLYNTTIQSYWHYAILGFWIGLAILARVDMAIWSVVCGLYLLRFPLKKVLITPLVALITVSPVWIYNYIHTHSVIPESGQAVKTIVAFHQMLHLTTKEALFQAAFKLNLLSDYNDISLILCCFLLLILSTMSFYGAVSQKKWTFECVIASGVIGTFAFYVFYLPAFWFFHRYLTFTIIASVILIYMYLSRSQAKWIYAPISVLIFFNLLNIHLFFAKPTGSLSILNDGDKGYMRVSEILLQALPENSKIGAMQSGALSYFAIKKHQHIFNLDGVVNKKAFLAIQNKSMDNYLLENKIEYFADWKFNAFWLKSLSPNNQIELKPLFSSPEKQGENQTTVYQIRKK